MDVGLVLGTGLELVLTLLVGLGFFNLLWFVYLWFVRIIFCGNKLIAAPMVVLLLNWVGFL